MTETAPVPADSLRLSTWLPYRLFVIAARIARPLESYYSETFGLSQAAWRILAVIAERDGVSASEIGHACALDPFAVSRGIGQLVEHGFATRRTSKTDRRYAAVTITRRGRDAFDKIATLGRIIEADLLSALSADERAMMDSALRKLEGESVRIESTGWRGLLADGGNT